MTSRQPPYSEKSDNIVPLREAEIRHIAAVASDQAVTKTFRAMGLDIQDLDKVNELRDDFKYLRDQREGAEEAKKYLKKGAVGLALGAIPGMLYAFWDVILAGLQAKFGGQ